jgi:hypothetical protein
MVTSGQLQLEISREFLFRVCTFYLFDNNIDIILSIGQMLIFINNESKHRQSLDMLPFMIKNLNDNSDAK